MLMKEESQTERMSGGQGGGRGMQTTEGQGGE